ncbi:MAG TPA: ACP S-malonyltransferase [Dissulfurispiraceae bacterium]|nr:ACP S-malonyltransferase [Dissulfurispiraceae bacterium]
MALCFAFPGQGSQHVGMAKDLFDRFAAVRKLYEEASEALAYDVASLSFNGPAGELNRTEKTQPCLLVASIAALTALTQNNVEPTAVIGHSLGEYSALVAAGSLSLKDAVRLTELRGRIMQEAVPEGKGLMAAILGLDKEKIQEVCASVTSGYVGVANYNCPGQIVISGEKAAVEEAIKKAKDRDARRAVSLAVSVPSHSALMKDAAERFEKALDEFALGDAKIPFVCNSDARHITRAADIRSALVRQLSQSVLWEDCVKAVFSSFAQTFIEVGPGKVLSGLIRRIEPSAKVMNVEDGDSLSKTLAELQVAGSE